MGRVGSSQYDYGENRVRLTLTLTPTAIASLEQAALDLNVSKSEVIERYARSLIDGVVPASPTLDLSNLLELTAALQKELRRVQLLMEPEP